MSWLPINISIASLFGFSALMWLNNPNGDNTVSIVVFAIAVGFLFLALTIAGSEEKEHAVRADKASASLKTMHDEQWKNAFKHHDRLVKTFEAATTDEKSLILYPTLKNTQSTLAKAVQEEMSLAERLRPQSPSVERIESTAYSRTLTRLDNAINAFLNDAKDKGWDGLSAKERSEMSAELERFYQKQEAAGKSLSGSLLI